MHPGIRNMYGSGERGAWYDLSDMATLFQDVAATTPVTVPGQPVRLVLDKSGNDNHMILSVAHTLYEDANGHKYLNMTQGAGSVELPHALRPNTVIAMAINRLSISTATIVHSLSPNSGGNDYFQYFLQTSERMQTRHRALSQGYDIKTTAVSATGTVPLNSVTSHYAVTRPTVGNNAQYIGTLGPYAVDSNWPSSLALGTVTTYSTGTNHHWYATVIIERDLSETERTDVTAYLQSKAHPTPPNTVTNYVRNPNPVAGGYGWTVHTPGNTSLVYHADGGSANRPRVVVTIGSTSGVLRTAFNQTAETIPVTPGERIYFTAKLKASVARIVRIEINWTGPGTWATINMGDTVPGQWATFYGSVEVPAGATAINIARFTSGSSLLTGDSYEIADVSLTKEFATYFDGSMEDDSYEYGWMGTPNDSYSVRNVKSSEETAFIRAFSATSPGFINESNPLDLSPFTSNRTIRYTPQRDLPAGEYTWRVRGRDPFGNGEWSDWTPYRTFIINNPIDHATGDISSVTDLIRRKIKIRLDDDVSPFEDDLIRQATRKLAETASSSDLARKKPGKRLADGVSTIDNTVARMLRVLTVDDAVDAIDRATRQIMNRKADTVATADSPRRKTGKRATDTATTADQMTKGLLRSLESIALVSDIVSKASARPVNDTVSANDTVSKEAQPRPADVQSVVDSSYRLIGKVLAEIINTDDETPRKIWVAFKSAVGLTDAVYNAISGLHADEVSTSEDSHRSTGIGLNDAPEAIDSVTRKSITQLQSDIAHVGDAMRRLYHQYNAETLVATDESARRVRQLKTDLVQALDNTGITMRLLRSESVSPSENIVRSLIKHLADQATPVDMVGKAFTTKTADEVMTTDLVLNTIRLLTNDQVVLSDETIELIRRVASRELVARSERGMVARSDDAIAKQARTVNAQNDTIKARSTR